MSGNLEWNKIFGAGLATVFTILVVQQASGFVYATKAPEKMGYAVDIPEEGAEGGAEAALPPDWGTLIPVADLAAGEAAFARCQACHTINAGGAKELDASGCIVAPGAVDLHTHYDAQLNWDPYASLSGQFGAPSYITVVAPLASGP